MLSPVLTFRRAREERLPQLAGSLTFTSVLAAVPLLATCFALFTHFPVFRRLQEALQEHLLRNLLPADIAKTVLKHMGHFAANAGGLTLVGFLFVLATALLMMLAVENALNRIWQVKKNRPLLRRLGMFLLMIAVGPMALGASLWATSRALGASQGLLKSIPPELAFVLNMGPVILGTLVLAGLFYFVPNTIVRRRDALLGGLVGSIAFELGKHGFAIYLLHVPTHQTLYGAFAALPVFLLWVYFSWFVTLVAALVAANLGKRAPRRAITRAAPNGTRQPRRAVSR